MHAPIKLPFDNSYARLPERFYAKQLPTPVSSPGLIRVNHGLAQTLGIDPLWLESIQGIDVLAGNSIPAGAEPIATAYAGHQFGGWNPQLGDGRAILLGELVGTDGVRYDLQLKGAGRTPWSRGGDGRAPIGPVLREYIVSESMATMGVPTSRALAAVTTGEWVMRNGAEPGAILARVAQSHIRIGTFQFFGARNDIDALRLLVDHVIQRHYPQAIGANNPASALLDCVVSQQAQLIAHWQLLGFIHGVMNTDNMLLSGETIDYGPCAFMDTYDPETVFSSIDHNGRYAYANQPGIAYWNLGALAQSLLPLLAADQDQAVATAQQAIDAFPPQFQRAYQAGMGKKLGLAELMEGDDVLAQDLLEIMASEHADFTLTFRRLSELAGDQTGGATDTGELFAFSSAFTPWLERWQTRLQLEKNSATERQRVMLTTNPVFIPRNHLVEEAIQAALTDSDFAPFTALVDVLADPFTYRAQHQRYATPPRAEQIVRQTFCGT
jgi:uncharacterized protein YdiU (UPF0061 family)